MMHGSGFPRPQAWRPIALPLLFGIALSGCETIKSLEDHGLAASAFHGAYCEADEASRERIELMLMFDNGSPKLDIHCEPHRAPEGIDPVPRLQ